MWWRLDMVPFHQEVQEIITGRERPERQQESLEECGIYSVLAHVKPTQGEGVYEVTDP